MPRSRMLTVLLAVASLVAAGIAAIAFAPTASAADADVRINEFSSNNPDFIELINIGAGTVNLTGWVLKDNSESNSYTFPSGSSIAAGAVLPLSGEGVQFVFGLGNGDAVRLFNSGGTLIDGFTYPAHPPLGNSYSRCPNGSGNFITTQPSSKGALNNCAAPAGAVKINEFSSNNPDFIELINTAGVTVDLSGWVLKDNSDSNSYTFPGGSSIAAGAILPLSGEGVQFVFGLGNGDAVRLFDSGGVQQDGYTYPAHPPLGKSYGRCPDGSGDFTITQAATKGSPNSCAPVLPNVKINEVESNGDPIADWVELKNLGATSVDVSGWKIVDNDPSHLPTPVVIPANTTIAAGGYYAIYTEIGQTPGFGLGAADSATLYLPDGSTQVDTTSWTAHAATTWGRCPDGTGSFGNTTTPTRGIANACSPVRINEVDSDPTDFIELTNISNAAVDITGWSVKDNDDTHVYTFPATTTIAAHSYLVVEPPALSFGLGSADSARLFDASNALIESYSWTAHAVQSYGRCKDGIGNFVDQKAVTKGAANSCPGLDTFPWPGGQTVTTADLTNTFIADLSGLAFDPADPDVLWAAQNKRGTLYKLVRDGSNNWVPAAGWPKDPLFPGGTGAPDTEGITIGPDGFVYLTTERDNNASGIPLNSILRIDPSGTGPTLTATAQWNLTSQIPGVTGANLGIEGVTFIPDSFLTARGFVDQSTGAAYNPSNYPLHGSGLFVVAIEATGNLIAFALDSDGTTAHKIATIDSGFTALADVDFDPELGRLRAVTDDTFDGKTSLLKIDSGGAFVVDVAYDRPATAPNLNNEGLAVAPQSRCVGGTKEVLWSDDGDTDGHSLRRGTINCTPPVPQTITFSTAPAAPVVGETYLVSAIGGGSGNPVVLSIAPATASVCSLVSEVVHFDHPGTCTINATQAAAQGYLAGAASQSVVVGTANTTTSVAVTPTTVIATVAVTAPGAAPITGTVDFTVDGNLVGSAGVGNGGVATLNYVVPSGADHVVLASYSGNADLNSSTGTTQRRDPEITAAVSSAAPATSFGWYRTSVTITFTCTPHGAALTGPCPAPVTLSNNGANQSVTRSISATDGGADSVTVSGINIDKTAPIVAVTGVVQGGYYLFIGTQPPAKCVAADALSGVASCTVTNTHVGLKWTSTAKATDKAGNVATKSVTYTAVVLFA